MKIEYAECGGAYFPIGDPKEGFKPVKCVLCGSKEITVTEEVIED